MPLAINSVPLTLSNSPCDSLHLLFPAVPNKPGVRMGFGEDMGFFSKESVSSGYCTAVSLSSLHRLFREPGTTCLWILTFCCLSPRYERVYDSAWAARPAKISSLCVERLRLCKFSLPLISILLKRFFLWRMKEHDTVKCFFNQKSINEKRRKEWVLSAGYN